MINRRAGLASFFKPNPASSENIFRHLNEAYFPNLDFQYIEHRHHAFGAYHTKQCIIDNQVAYLCSGDVGIDHNYKQGEPGWRELLTTIRGSDLVKLIREDYISAWESKHCQPLKGKKR